MRLEHQNRRDAGMPKQKCSIIPFLRCGQSRTWKKKPPNEGKELEYKFFWEIAWRT
jgi:hypothetical protein